MASSNLDHCSSWTDCALVSEVRCAVSAVAAGSAAGSCELLLLVLASPPADKNAEQQKGCLVSHLQLLDGHVHVHIPGWGCITAVAFVECDSCHSCWKKHRGEGGLMGSYALPATLLPATLLADALRPAGTAGGADREPFSFRPEMLRL